MVGAVTLAFVVWAIVTILTYEETPEHWDRPPYATIDEKLYQADSDFSNLPEGYVEFGTLSAEAASASGYPKGSPLFRNENQPQYLYLLDEGSGIYYRLVDQRLNDKLLYYEGQWYLPDQAQYVPSERRHEIPSYRKSDCTPTGEFTFYTSDDIPTVSCAVTVGDWKDCQILRYDPDPNFLFLMQEGTPTMYYPFASADFCGLDYSDLITD